MKVKDLIAALQLCDQELEVYAQTCNMKQYPERVCRPEILYAENLGDCISRGNWSTMESVANANKWTKRAILL